MKEFASTTHDILLKKNAIEISIAFIFYNLKTLRIMPINNKIKSAQTLQKNSGYTFAS